MEMKNNSDFWKVMMGRKSVRNFKKEPVEKEKIEQILRAAMAAPSAINLQPWAFVVITERRTLDELGKKMPFAKMLFEAQAAIVVCGLLKNNLMSKVVPTLSDYWVMDCSAATENILLSAEALGLGAVWTAVFPGEGRVKEVRKILEMPEGIIPLNIIPIGVPEGKEKAKNKFKAERIHWEKW